MPELPEVETIRRDLEKQVLGKKIDSIFTSGKKLRENYPQNIVVELKNRKISSIGRRSKYLLIHLDNKKILVVHLGMSGKILFRKHKILEPGRHDHFIMNFTDNLQIVFNDPRRFGLITLIDEGKISKNKLFKNLGIEPLSKDFNGVYIRKKLKNKTKAIKLAIMDAGNLVGVGNIYANEALFRSKINPKKASGKISLSKLNDLAKNIQTVLKEAIKSGGSTLRDYTKSNGDVGHFQHSFKVYGREKEPCVSCGSSIKRIVQQGRSTFFCPQCQK